MKRYRQDFLDSVDMLAKQFKNVKREYDQLTRCSDTEWIKYAGNPPCDDSFLTLAPDIEYWHKSLVAESERPQLLSELPAPGNWEWIPTGGGFHAWQLFVIDHEYLITDPDDSGMPLITVYRGDDRTEPLSNLQAIDMDAALQFMHVLEDTRAPK